MNGILYSDANTLILDVPHGKPDPKAPFPEEGPDTRPRVPQPPQKTFACNFYAMNMLRDRIGKLAGPGREEARKIEKIFSDLRKRETVFWHTWRTILPEFEAFLEKELALPDKTRATIAAIMPKIRPLLLKINHPEITKLFEDFCLQSEIDSFETYSKIRQSFVGCNIYRAVLKTLGISAKKTHDEMRCFKIQDALQKLGHFDQDPSDYLHLVPSWEKFIEDPMQKLAIFHRTSILEARDRFGFVKSSWNKRDPINKLTECLVSEGPLLVEGCFGTAMYAKNPPTPFKEPSPLPIPPVFVWKPKDRSPVFCGHTVVIIGTRIIKDREYVCFVDPKDGSDPKNPLQRKTYMISYQNFIDNIYDRKGFSSAQLGDLGLGYASYFPKV